MLSRTKVFQATHYRDGSAGPSESRHGYFTRIFQGLIPRLSAPEDHTFDGATNFLTNRTEPKSAHIWNATAERFDPLAIILTKLCSDVCGVLSVVCCMLYYS